MSKTRKPRTMPPPVPCPCCGMSIGHQLERHLLVCDRLPLPLDMAQSYWDNALLNLADLALSHHVAIGTIRERVVHGLGLMGLTWEEAQERRKERRREIRQETPRPVQQGAHGRICARCTMLLADDDKGDLCRFCQPNAPDYLLYMASIAYEGL